MNTPTQRGTKPPSTILTNDRLMQFTRALPLLLALILLTLLSPVTHAQEGLRGDPEAAAKAWPLIEDGALVIDVRSKEEYESGALEGAVNIPHDDTEALKQAIGEDRSRPVVMYCGSGRRVDMAIEALEADGYDALYNASGLDALEATRPESG